MPTRKIVIRRTVHQPFMQNPNKNQSISSKFHHLYSPPGPRPLQRFFRTSTLPPKKKLNDPLICPSHIFFSQRFTSLRVFLTPPLGVENLRLSFSLGGNTAARLQLKEWKCRSLVAGRFQVEGIQCQFSKFS